MNNKRVHVSLAGGLGNQLFQIAAALSLTSGEIIVHDYLGNARKRRNNRVDIQGFELPERIQFAPEEQLSRFNLRLLNLLYRSSVEPHKILNRFMHLPILNVIKNRYFSGIVGEKINVIHARDNGYFEIAEIRQETLLIGYFQSAYWPQLLEKNGELKKIRISKPSDTKMKKLEPQNKVLAIHVRLGDYVNEPRIGLLQKAYFASNITSILNSESVDEIWLFSDNPNQAKEYFPSDVRDRLRIVPEMDAAETLDLMREANFYIISNSTFSWWGAFLARTKNPLVVAPSLWFKSMSDPSQILPSNWIRAESLFR